MKGVIVPLQATDGTKLTQFLADKPYRNEVAVTPIEAYESSKAPVAATVESKNLACIEEIYEWATDGLPTSAPLDVINRLKFTHISGVRNNRMSDSETVVRTRSLFMDADLPNGAVGVQFSAPVDTESVFTHWGLFIHGYGEVYQEVTGMLSQSYWTEILASVVYAEVRANVAYLGVEDVLTTLEHRPICSVHEDTRGDGWGYDFSDNGLLVAIKNSRTPKRYDLIAKSANDTIFWHRVGENLSGASLVTRIRQNKVSALPYDQFQVKAVKDSQNGTYTVWVRRSIGWRALEVEHGHEAEEAAWERFSATMKKAFMKEYHAALNIDSEQVA